MLDAKYQFRLNLKRLIKEKGHKSNDVFGALCGMSGGKIQRLTDISADGNIDLNDASLIAEKLDTTLGYMCGSQFTDFMLSQTKMMHNHFKELSASRALAQTIEAPMMDYLDEILTRVDALNRVKKD